ncbi:hypothetical protein [Streptomyces sp. SID3212]|uniref:hypothetical protein n=1 Tax=Streptomyces sp. SID3212 TaxID=2690259 RepID=UPI0013680C6F|nr:hypothetical protein [Streptomyces sp. SID3212]MYV57426.1 hypothetical protein [Streptomyces sp. SID3212]
MKASSSERLFLLGRRTAMGGVAVLLLAAGFWSSWGTAQHVVLAKGREHGTLTVTSCSASSCTGSYDPDGPAGPRTGMSAERSVAVKEGERVPVVVKPDTDEVVRTGLGGQLHAWLPFGGALLLASPLIGAGLRMTRTAWVTGLAGLALLLATFLAL